MEERVIEIIYSITAMEKDFLTVNYDKVKLWNSLDNVEIILALEEEFDIAFEIEEIAYMDCLRKLVETVKRKVS